MNRRFKHVFGILLLIVFVALLYVVLTRCDEDKVQLVEAADSETSRATSFTIINKDYGDAGIKSDFSNPLIFNQTRFISAGPYTVELIISYSKKEIEDCLKKEAAIINLGSAGKLFIDKAGCFRLFREEERRIAERAHLTTNLNVGLFDYPEHQPIKIVFKWDGMNLILLVDGKLLGKVLITGTKVLGELRVCDFPVTIHHIKFSLP